MKVFLSHKKEDAAVAACVGDRLQENGVASYLDILDHWMGDAGDEMADYLRRQMSECTHLIAVISSETKASWWVPWEIGVASERVMPLATFAGTGCIVPDYLRKWPYLKSTTDVDKYVRVALETRPTILEKRGGYTKAEQQNYAKSFHRSLKRSLGQ